MLFRSHFFVLPVWLYHRTAAFFIPFDFMGTFALIVLMVTHEDNAGRAAAATADIALFFRNARLFSIWGFSPCQGFIRPENSDIYLFFVSYRSSQVYQNQRFGQAR